MLDWLKQSVADIRACRDLRARSELKFSDVLMTACTEVQFYRQLNLGGMGLDAFPCVDRATLASRPIEFSTERYGGKTLYRDSTSGRSGIPLTVYSDAPTLAYRLFKVTAMYYQLIPELSTVRLGPGTTCIGVVKDRSSSARPNANPLLNFSQMRACFVDGDVAESREQLISLAKASTPLINVSPSALDLFLSILRDAPDLKSRLLTSLRAIVSSGDNLLESDRRQVEQMLNVPLYNAYQTTEVGLVAFQCDKIVGALHVNDLDNVVEILSEGREQPAPEGYGEIVVSSKISRPMMFLRYRTGDFGELRARCRCGALVKSIENLDGRVSVTYRIGDLAIDPYKELDPVFKSLEIQKFVMTQYGDRFAVYYRPLDLEMNLDESLRDALRARLANADVTVTRADFVSEVRKVNRYRVEGAAFVAQG